ncbi:FMN-binding protein [Leucobacter coleopterorum]|uniref:FMN-binding protein n=1 Tax=Leucobacter coleopterorum TaxID=2714933 RepID=A0ABX6JYT3_9MICO|nr:FMN-binding protein [Leucobacter coleopterorum]QIM17955.1 FMN-binding protein [Leucobacter coleopterorum]
MRKRALAIGILSTSAVLGVGWQIGTTIQPAISTAAPTQTQAVTGVDGTFVGAVSQTPYGNVQVQITVAKGTITDVSALHLTDSNGRSVSISNRAEPVLRQEALNAQSASIQSVSGATYTSEGYISSLQAAIDQAGL